MFDKMSIVTIALIASQCWIWGSEFTGIVVDQNQKPLAYAIVAHPQTGSWVIADEDGGFFLQTERHNGDSLIVTRYGYLRRTVKISGNQMGKIILEKDVIRLAPVMVEGAVLPSLSPHRSVVLTSTDRMNNLSSYQRIPGIVLKSYGGRAGIINIGLDGGQSEHTKIILDGIDLTSPQNGQTDLSEIPSAFFQQVVYSRYSGSNYGSGAMDGVIHLNPWFNRSFFNFSLGDYGYKSAIAGYKMAFSNTAVQCIGGRTTSTEDYPYTVAGSTLYRKNNSMDQQFFGNRIQYRSSEKIMIKSSFFLSASDRGVAGSIFDPSTVATRSNTLNLINASLVRLLPAGYINIQISRRANDENYVDISFNADSKHKVAIQNIKLKWKHDILDRLDVYTAFELRNETINSSDAGAHERTLLAVTSGLNYMILPSVMLRPSVRVDRDASLTETTRDIFIQAQLPLIGQIKSRFGTGFRIPTFNDLYWPGVGNSDLNPEKSEFVKIGIEQPILKEGWVEWEWNRRLSRDLITWAPGADGKWRPMNLNKVTRNSASVSFVVPKLTKQLSVSGYWTRTDTRDHTTDKNLPYIPEQTGQLLFQYTGQVGTLDMQLFYNGKRTYSVRDRENNPVDINLVPFTNVNLGLHIKIPRLYNMQLHLTIENLLDTDTAFFPKYPEPGRRLNGGMTIQF